MGRYKKYFLVFIIGFLVLMFQSVCKRSGDNKSIIVPLPDYWPTISWQTTYPEQQGMSSRYLADLIDTIKSNNYPIRSVLVIRKGYLVLEAYFSPFQKNIWHIIHSCTKSINSTLIGIAIDRGFINGVNEKVLDIFSQYNTINNNDQRKQSLNLEHLLKMSSGMDARDSYLYNWEGLNNMRSSNDWTKYVLDLPMINDPGGTFDYSNCASYLIAAILQKYTFKNGLEFANEYLFSPIGIRSNLVDWPTSPQGVVYGWGQIRMRPEDMARFGFLFLHKGNWDGEQVISEEWVSRATSEQIQAGTLSEGYGYQWWVDKENYYMALGYAGQYIIVHPERNLVVVFSSALKDQNFAIPESLYNQYILPAVQSDDPISNDAQNQSRLDSLINQIANPDPQEVSPLPAIASVISGKLYAFEENENSFNSIGLTFGTEDDEAVLRYSYNIRDLTLPIGLDDVFRVTFQDSYWRAVKGHWEDRFTFVIDYQLADFSQRSEIWLTFDNSGNRVQMRHINKRTGTETVVNGISED